MLAFRFLDNAQSPGKDGFRFADAYYVIYPAQ
jgi:hypothetical protein